VDTLAVLRRGSLGNRLSNRLCAALSAAYGGLVIGLVDNLLRPILVGSDTKIPDYAVLISTLGGIEIFGMNGIVLGPLIAAMFLVVWDILSASRHAAHDDQATR